MALKHVAIIMDGNRRWANLRDEPIEVGHYRGAEAIDDVLRAAKGHGIKVLTLYAFSTENWGRDDQEVRTLMNLFELFLEKKVPMMLEEGVRLATIGDIEKLPKSLQEKLFSIKEQTKNGKNIDLVLAMNYGGRDEIVRAAKKAAKEGDITERSIAKHLDTAGWPDPDLLIRTSDEHRLSNFLLWQCSYAEIVVLKQLWPDFGPEDLQVAIDEYVGRERRLGE